MTEWKKALAITVIGAALNLGSKQVMGKNGNGGLGIAGSVKGAILLFAVVFVGGMGYKYGQNKGYILLDT